MRCKAEKVGSKLIRLLFAPNLSASRSRRADELSKLHWPVLASFRLRITSKKVVGGSAWGESCTWARRARRWRRGRCTSMSPSTRSRSKAKTHTSTETCDSDDLC